MYFLFRNLLGKTIDTKAVLAEAMAIAGNERPAGELILALSIKALDLKYRKEIDELKALLIPPSKLSEGAPLVVEDLQPPKIVELSSHRNMKEADQNLQEIVGLMNGMTEEQIKELDLRERQKAAQEDKTITLGEEMDSKDIYLHYFAGPGKVEQIVGLHAIGHAGPYHYTHTDIDGKKEDRVSNFMALDTWGNEYDNEHNMLGRGSFRLHTHDIEEYAKEMEAEGWVRYEGPKRKN